MNNNLKTKSLRLRELTFSDAKFIAEKAKNKEIIKYTFVIAPPLI